MFAAKFSLMTLPPYGPLLTPKYPLYPDIAVKDTKFPYGGIRLTENPAYPASYAPNLIADQIFATDTSLARDHHEIDVVAAAPEEEPAQSAPVPREIQEAPGRGEH